MPDIIMCAGFSLDFVCPLRNKCYNFTATPTQYRQAYFITIPYKNDRCEYFVDNGGNQNE